MAATFETSFAPASVSFLAAGETENFTVNAGTGANRVLVAWVLWKDDEGRTATMTYATVGLTSLGAKVTSVNGYSLHGFRLAAPASGSNTLAVTLNGGFVADSPAMVGAIAIQDTDAAGTPVDGFASASGSGSAANIVSSVTVTGDNGDCIVACHCTRNVVDFLTATPTGYTERQDAVDATGLAMEFGEANGSAALNTQATWSNGAFAVEWVAVGINVNQSGGAPATVANRSARTLLGVG